MCQLIKLKINFENIFNLKYLVLNQTNVVFKFKYKDTP